MRVGVVTDGGLWSAGLILLVGQIGQVVLPPENADAEVILWTTELPLDISDKRILALGDDRRLLRTLEERRIGGVIVPQATVGELAMGLRAVANGDMFVHPSLVSRLLNPEPEPQSIEQPTPREIDVLRLIARGYTNRQAGEVLNISVRTVDSHRAQLREKLHLRSRVELVRYARENDYI